MSTFSTMHETVMNLKKNDGTPVVGEPVKGVEQLPVGWSSVTSFFGGARRQPQPDYYDAGLAI